MLIWVCYSLNRQKEIWNWSKKNYIRKGSLDDLNHLGFESLCATELHIFDLSWKKFTLYFTYENDLFFSKKGKKEKKSELPSLNFLDSNYLYKEEKRKKKRLNYLFTDLFHNYGEIQLLLIKLQVDGNLLKQWSNMKFLEIDCTEELIL